MTKYILIDKETGQWIVVEVGEKNIRAVFMAS
jgi:hypothetical protein